MLTPPLAVLPGAAAALPAGRFCPGCGQRLAAGKRHCGRFCAGMRAMRTRFYLRPHNPLDDIDPDCLDAGAPVIADGEEG